MSNETEDRVPEIEALAAVVKALGGLGSTAQTRILKYAADAYGIEAFFGAAQPTYPAYTPPAGGGGEASGNDTASAVGEEVIAGELEGVSSVAIKWMTRSGFDAKSLGKIFSLGGDEIDLIAADVPGEKKKERMRSVLLLLGVASYLGSGTPRVADEKLRETCQHYDALDQSNFATNIKAFSVEVAGNKDAGYTLNQRGLTSAKDLIKEMLG